MTAEIIILRIIHILGGVFWVGGTIVMAAFLGRRTSNRPWDGLSRWPAAWPFLRSSSAWP
jgi:hypothetical protein